MNGLEGLRKTIDESDDSLIEALSERMLAARVIGRRKLKAGKSVRDATRERQVRKRLLALALSRGIDPAFLSRIINEILRESIRCQKRKETVVAFQGERGAFSEEAALSVFPDCVLLPCRTFADAMRAAETGDADYTVLPIENSTEGSVTGVYDLLVDSSLHPVREVSVRVRHSLCALPGQPLGHITEIYSHPQALAQCRRFIEGTLPKARTVPFYDTAGAAKMIAQVHREGAAAIASASASRFYGLTPLASGIEDNKENFTRFLVFSKRANKPEAGGKTSLVFSLPHTPGVLARVLNEFAREGVNLSLIESRPSRKGAWNYLFFVDVEAGMGGTHLKHALKKIRPMAGFVKVLGGYPKAPRSSLRGVKRE